VFATCWRSELGGTESYDIPFYYADLV
jgi:hypothetical protein